MKRKWTDDQKNAIKASGGSILVSAAAGSGKTAVLVERLIKKITDREKPIDADKFLVVTFTKAAASEMRSRVLKRLRELLKDSPTDNFLQHQILLLEKAQICTMDSFFSNIVRENFEQLGVSPTLRVAEETLLGQISDEVLDAVLEEKYKQNDEKFTDLVRYFGDEDDRNLKKEVLNVYRKIRSFPFPFKWLDEQLSLYQSDTPVNETDWGRFILQKIRKGVEFCIQLLDRMMLFAESDTGIYNAYSPACLSDVQGLKELYNVCQNDNWNDVYYALNNFNFMNLKPAPRGSDEFVKERFGELRRLLKTEVDNLKKLICCTEENYILDMKTQAKIIEALFDLIKEFYLKLDEEKRELNIADFSDFAYFTLQLVADENGNPTEFAKRFSMQFDEILLDEYQDTNLLQDLIFKCVSKNCENLFFVGDLKQSIYRFRNADPTVFMEKKSNFIPYGSGDFPAYITLSKNFRSREGVTEGINAVFSRVMSYELGDVNYTDDEKLNCGAEYPKIENNSPETALQIIDTKEDDSDDHRIVIEARETARRIAKMIKDKTPVTENGELRPCRGEDFAILLRSGNNGISDIYASALKEENIDADTESCAGYFSSREVSVMLSLLKVLDNPICDTELSAVLLSPMFSFSFDELSSLFVYNPNKSLYASLLLEAERGKKKAKNFIKIFKALREKSAVIGVQKLIQYIYDTTDFIEVVSNMSNSAVREANLKLLLKYALDFESSGSNGLSNFVSYISSLIEADKDFEVATPAISASQAVKIMTIHKSKGLEYPIVIVANCSKKHNFRDLTKDVIINSKLGMGIKFIDREKLLKYETVPYVAVKNYEKQNLLSEEMRLLYVAMTRAKEKLILNITETNLESKLTKKIESYLDSSGNVEPYAASKGMSYSDWLLLAFLPFSDFNPIKKKYGCVAKQKEGCPLDILLLTDKEEPPVEKKKKKAQKDDAMLKTLKDRIYYEYPYKNDTVIPAKLSVTEITHKGNGEVILSAPKFMAESGFTPTQKGTIFHRALQFADFALGKEDAQKELDRLIEKGYISSAEAEAIDIEKLKAFFNSPLTERILNADRVLREYKFFDTISANEAGYEGDSEVLIQGIADCVLEENQKGVLIDFKTDVVSNGQVLKKRYQKQMELYRRTLKNIFPNGMDECILYSVHLGEEITIKF